MMSESAKPVRRLKGQGEQRGVHGFLDAMGVLPVGATADTIWRVPAYLPYIQPTLTDEAIAAATSKIGHKIPIEYLELLKTQNGGHIRFSLPESVHSLIAGIGPNFPSLTDFNWDVCQEYVSFPLEGLVPFDGDGHWHLCLDYRGNPQVPAITFVDIECEQQTHVADSFAEYLNMLQIGIEGEFVVEAVSDIEMLKSELSRTLGVSFDPTDTVAHGYPLERARLLGEENPQWFWISPNNVPRGFVRPDDPLYLELKDLRPGFGEMFPGLPASSYILSATNGVPLKVVDTCRHSGMTTRPLRDYLENI